MSQSPLQGNVWKLLLHLASLLGAAYATKGVQTNPADVSALQAFLQTIRFDGGRLYSWGQQPADPCSEAACAVPAAAGTAMPALPADVGLPPCNWAGIACDAWRVTRISLPCLERPCTRPLIGRLVPELAQMMTNLTSLDFTGNQLTGALPAGISRLSNLQTALLGGNLMQGPLPASWANLPHLQTLDLHGNKLSGMLPPAWGQLSELQALLLDGNALSGSLPTEYGNLHQLLRLSVGNNKLSGVIPLGWSSLSQLTNLSVSGNCGICGSAPPFPQQRSGAFVLDARATSINLACDRSNCRSFPLAIFSQAMICLGVALGVVLLIGLTRLRNRYPSTTGHHAQRSRYRLIRIVQWLLFGPVQSAPVYPVPAPPAVPALMPADCEQEPPVKCRTPTVVIMPDGQSISYAVRVSEDPAAGCGNMVAMYEYSPGSCASTSAAAAGEGHQVDEHRSQGEAQAAAGGTCGQDVQPSEAEGERGERGGCPPAAERAANGNSEHVSHPLQPDTATPK